jgi:group I intron endonuclease
LAYIYQITNDVNGKIYIGKTEFSIEKRFKEHCSDSVKERCKNRPLYKAMNKYGIEHFHIELIEETDNPEEREQFWIEQKGSFKFGYNATTGGDGRKYLDYDLIVNTYQELQNISKTAKLLNISVDTVTNVLKVRKIDIKSGAEIVREQYGKILKMYQKDKLIKSFSTVADAAQYVKDIGLSSASNIRGIAVHLRDCANGKRKSAYKHSWRWG